MFKVGDQVYYRSHGGAVETGSVYQVEGGPDGDLTEVYWPRLGEPRWMATDQLWAQEPVWAPGHLCECGCPFADHCGPRGGCASHQAHAFVAA